MLLDFSLPLPIAVSYSKRTFQVKSQFFGQKLDT